MNEKVAVIILAAGKGKRMKSDLPKVLAEAAGKPLIKYVLDTAKALPANRVIAVVGHGKQLVIDALPDWAEWVEQKEQLGTGHAVDQARELLSDYPGITMILCGDVPLLRVETLRSMLATHNSQRAVCTLMTAELDDPARYGRIVRDEAGEVIDFVEAADATPEILAIHEINVGVYCFDTKMLFEKLPLLGNNNAQGEYYLPDVARMLLKEGKKVCAVKAKDPVEILGVNSPEDLAFIGSKISET